MSSALSKRVSMIKPSATMAVSAKASQLRNEGRDIINLSVGEPDFDTPDFIKKAAIEAIEQGCTKYTLADGTLELKDAIINKLKKDNQLHYERHEIIASTGLKQGLYNIAQAILNEGDEAIIPAPYWVSYPAMVELASGKPVIIECPAENRFKLTANQLDAAITAKTRLLILNSPSNPSGMAYTKEELKALGDVLLKHPKVMIASDDMYEYIFWGDGQYVNLLNACPELKDRTLIGNGLSKAYAMTGWRIGYVAGPKEIIAAMKTIQSQSTSCPCSITQKASVAALNADRDFFEPMLKAYKGRHDFVLSALESMEGVSCLPSDGTFYLFPNMEAVIQKLGLEDDIALAEFFLDKAGVAMVPGTAFGTPGHLRISCATSEENLSRAMTLMNKSLSSVQSA